MCQKQFILYFLIIIIINNVNSIEDLLDQYVKHVDRVNSISHHRTKRNVNEFIDNTNNSESIKKRDLSDFVQWTHSEILDNKGFIILRWQPRHQEISFRIEAKTKGYVGIGFSPNGGMEGADILIGWVDDRDLKPHLLVIYFFVLFLFSILSLSICN